MKITIAIFGILITSILNARETNLHDNEDTLNTYISNLQIGDSVSYKTFLTSCLSGDRYEIMDSICFFRDSLDLQAIYKNKIYIIQSIDLKLLSEIENRILTVGMTSSTSFYNYIVDYQNEQGLLGFGEKAIWNELIHFITEK